MADAEGPADLNGVERELEWLLKRRVVVARCREMDLARWWNTNQQLGTRGASALRRGFPRTHHFTQARSVIAVAEHRCAQVLDPPGCVTLWRLIDTIEDAFEERWEDWLDAAPNWRPFFEAVARISSPDVASALRQMDLVTADELAALADLEMSANGHAISVLSLFSWERRSAALLALGFAKGAPSAPVIPYARNAGG